MKLRVLRNLTELLSHVITSQAQFLNVVSIFPFWLFWKYSLCSKYKNLFLHNLYDILFQSTNMLDACTSETFQGIENTQTLVNQIY